MKRILKLFPAALAVVALASCSNDELMSFNGSEELDPNYLYVTVEDEDGELTRGGFSEKVTADGIGRQIYFENLDNIKLYDNENNWRPQEWAYDATATARYRSEVGVKLFSKKVKATGENQNQYTNGYGVFPADRAYFENENRTKLAVDLSDLAYIEYKRATGKGETADSSEYQCPMPLWGVANSGRMTLKHLTAYLRVDISDVEAAAAGTSNVLVIQANKKLHQTFNAALGNSVDFLPEEKTVAPEISAEDQPIVGLTTNTTYTLANAECDNMIFVNLGATALGQTVIYVPLVPGATSAIATLAHDATVTKAGDVVTAIKTNAGIEKLEVIGVKDLTKVTNGEATAGKFYRIANIRQFSVEDINTPQALANAIKEKDTESDRDFVLTVKSVVNVKVGTDDNGFNMNFGGYQLKHNCTVQFDTDKGFRKQAPEIVEAGNKLIIKNLANAGDNTLTINYQKATTAEDLDDIIVDATVLGNIVFEGNNLYSLKNYSNDVLTVKTGANGVATDGRMTIDAYGKTVYGLTIMNNSTAVKIVNGTVNAIAFSENFDGNVTIHTEGASKINTVKYDNVKVNKNGAKVTTFAGKVAFTSKLTAPTMGYGTLTAFTGVKGVNNAIITALQLKHYDYSEATRILAKEIDLNGENVTWTPLADLARDLNGNIEVLPAATTVSTAPITQTDIKNMKFAPAANAGLFQSIGAVKVENIKFSNANVVGAAVADANIGTLAGSVTGAATIDNITVSNLSIAPTKSNTIMSAGAVVGCVSTTTAAQFTKVTTGGTITAYGNLGGIVGLLKKDGKVEFGTLTKTTGTNYKVTNVCAPNVTLTEEKENTNNSPIYAKYGQYVGSVETDATSTCGVVINLNSYTETVAPGLSALAKADFMNEAHETTYHAITLPQSLIGFSGFYTGNTLPIVWTARTDAWFAAVNVFGTDASADAAAKRIKYYTTLPDPVPAGQTAKILCTVAE